MWDCGTNCQNVGQMWDKIAKCGKCGNVGRLYSLGYDKHLAKLAGFEVGVWFVQAQL